MLLVRVRGAYQCDELPQGTCRHPDTLVCELRGVPGSVEACVYFWCGCRCNVQYGVRVHQVLAVLFYWWIGTVDGVVENKKNTAAQKGSLQPQRTDVNHSLKNIARHSYTCLYSSDGAPKGAWGNPIASRCVVLSRAR